MQISSSQPSDNRFPERPSDITRANREGIQRHTAESAERPKEEPTTDDPKGDVTKRLHNAREDKREKHDHRLHRARQQARDEHDHRLRRAREQARNEHDRRLHNARAKANAQPDIDVDAGHVEGGGRAAAGPQNEGDGLTISIAARQLVEHAQGDDRSNLDPHDSARAERVDELRRRVDAGELNTDELIARTAVRILSGDSGSDD